ncbi:hypothetical protein ACPXB3_19400 [Gordonia sp. DT219]|uniref:hypothetical protein n=1 Tax=Gordonia sp. DT219 TaxID=3416658 RepID=UPI003CF55CF5
MGDTASAASGLQGVLRLPWQLASAAADAAERVPVAGGAVTAARRSAHDVIDGVGTLAVATTENSIGALIRTIVDELSALDLTPLVAAIDLDRIVGAIDLDAVLARLDLDALLAQVDIAALIGRVDLSAIIAELDLDAVLDNLDLDTIVARVDLDGAVERVDIDAIIGRIDLIGLADDIIEGVDLPGIVREASTSVTADVMTDVRGSSERADDAVATLVNRMLRRKTALQVADDVRDGDRPADDVAAGREDD